MRPGTPRRGGPGNLGIGGAVALVVLLGSLAAPGAAGAGPVGAVAPTAETPVLTLSATPSLGSAPLWVNVTATVAGGTGPFNLSLCFGTVDHTSPPAGCGAGAAPDWSGATPLTFGHLYAGPGNFSVVAVVRDATGAGAGATALIVVTDGPTLSVVARASTSQGTAPAAVEFDSTIAGGTAPITIQWRFGDGTSGSGLADQPVAHVYEAAGTYVPSVTVSDAAGHRTTFTLSPIVVRAGAPGFLEGPTLSGTNLLPPVALLLGSVGLVALVVRSRRLQRLREEGDALVDSLWAEDALGPERPGTERRGQEPP